MVRFGVDGTAPQGMENGWDCPKHHVVHVLVDERSGLGGRDCSHIMPCWFGQTDYPVRG